MSNLANITISDDCFKRTFRYWTHNTWADGLQQQQAIIFDYMINILKQKKFLIMYGLNFIAFSIRNIAFIDSVRASTSTVLFKCSYCQITGKRGRKYSFNFSSLS